AKPACRSTCGERSTEVTEQNTNPTAQNPEPEFGAFVAIDWAHKKHYFSLQVAGSKRTETGTLDNTPESVEVWMAKLDQQMAGKPIAVALEQKRGSLVVMLSKYKSLHLYPVHPGTLSHYRNMWSPSGSKNDRKDADLLLELLVKNRDKLRPLRPDT